MAGLVLIRLPRLGKREDGANDRAERTFLDQPLFGQNLYAALDKPALPTSRTQQFSRQVAADDAAVPALFAPNQVQHEVAILPAAAALASASAAGLTPCLKVWTRRFSSKRFTPASRR